MSELSVQIRAVNDWETVQLGMFDNEVCSIDYAPFKGDKTYRYVVSRERNKTGQTDIEFQDNFIYRAILTNDMKSSDQEVITCYNQRGVSEKKFDEMNNDFGWKKLPFSFLEENTVFMIVMAMGKRLPITNKNCIYFPIYLSEVLIANWSHTFFLKSKIDLEEQKLFIRGVNFFFKK